MNRQRQAGFSMVELIIVVAIIGIIASLAIPFLQKAVRATENGNTFATMRTIASSQVGYYQTNSRFARLTEINNLMSNSLGTPSGNQLTRGKFTFTMEPPAPTDAQLRDRYRIIATRDVTGEGQIYVYAVSQTGEIRQLAP